MGGGWIGWGRAWTQSVVCNVAKGSWNFLLRTTRVFFYDD